MAKFAWYDPTITAISPVLGWYDSERVSPEELPPSDELFPLTSREWSKRFFGRFGIEDHELVAYPDEP